MKYMEIIEAPEYLYHYTSLDKLALILKNRTIRLNSLDKMDDLQEQRGQDIKNIGRFVFVSSWTSSADESIPMWKMYTDLTSGVRIRLKSNPFQRKRTSQNAVRKKLDREKSTEEEKDVFADTFLDLAHLIDLGIFSPQAWSGDILSQVVYIDDKKFLEPPIATYTGSRIELNLGPIGRYKNIGWSFQNEWRYIMYFYTMPFSIDARKTHEELLQIVQRMSNGTEPAPIDYFDLPIEPTCFSNMEITASPQLSPGNKILLDALIEKYNPDAKLVESQYKGLL